MDDSTQNIAVLLESRMGEMSKGHRKIARYIINMMPLTII